MFVKLIMWQYNPVDNFIQQFFTKFVICSLEKKKQNTKKIGLKLLHFLLWFQTKFYIIVLYL